MRKAQIEMMGLVVVVILVTIGIFFTVAFNAKDETEAEEPLIKQYAEDEFNNNLLIVMLETDLEDCNANIKELAQDAIRYKVTGRSLYNCEGEDSWTYLNKTINDTLVATLENYYDYRFSYTYTTLGGETTEIYGKEENCPWNHPRTSLGRQAITLYKITTGRAKMELYLCN